MHTPTKDLPFPNRARLSEISNSSENMKVVMIWQEVMGSNPVKPGDIFPTA